MDSVIGKYNDSEWMALWQQVAEIQNKILQSKNWRKNLKRQRTV